MSPGALRCGRGHSFDIARQGYVNLMPGGARPGTADTAGMVAAREAFLGAGHYAPLARIVADLAAHAVRAGHPAGRLGRSAAGLPAGTAPGPCVLDAGAGTGYYLRAVLDRLCGGPPSCGQPPQQARAAQGSAAQGGAPAHGNRSAAGHQAPHGGAARPCGIAMDISVRALRRAARAHPGIGAIAWDVWAPFPVRPSVVSVVLNVFAPRNGAEFRRVLHEDGTLIVVTPAPGHLAELVDAAGLLTVDERKEDRLTGSLAGHFALERREERTDSMRLSRAGAETLIAMGPAARHVDAAAIRARLAALPEPITVTAAFRISVYRPG